MMPEHLEQVSLIRVAPGESGQSFCERTDSPSNENGHQFHRSARSTCSKLLQDFGGIGGRVGFATLVESNE
jgi:hypothetical protein